MVSHSVEASWRLYICIPAKSSRDRREESASEVPVPTTGVEKRRRVRPSPPSRSRRQIRQVRELEGPTTCKHSRDCSHPPQLPTPRGNPQEFLSPGRPEPPGPVEMPVVWNPGHVSSAGRGPRKLICPNPTPTSLPGGGPRWSCYPSCPALGSNPRLCTRGEPNRARLAVRMRQPPTWPCFSPTSSSFSLSAPECSALFLQGGNIASKSVLGHHPRPPPFPAPRASAASQSKLHLTLQVTGPMDYSL